MSLGIFWSCYLGLCGKFLLPLLLYILHLLLIFEDFCAQTIVKLDKYYHEPQVVDDSLEVEEIGVPGESV